MTCDQNPGPGNNNKTEFNLGTEVLDNIFPGFGMIV
jgi:hypothetical protein